MHSEPWFRGHDGWWYFYRRERGKRRAVKLVEGRRNRKAAYERWHELCRKPHDQPLVVSESAVALVDLFLDWCQKNRTAGTYGIYSHHLNSFCQHIGADLLVAELKPKHVTAWLAGMNVSNSTKAGAVQVVRTCFNWLTREGHIPANPVASAKGPSKERREVILSEEEFQAVLQHSRPDFCRLLTFIRATGCRPQEAVAIEARHCELAQRRIVFPPSEAKGKRHPRVIYVSDTMLATVAKLCKKWPQGPIFRTGSGQPWNHNKVHCRFFRLKAKLGKQFCAYHLRHTFATDALQRLDPITVASLMGHEDASTLARNYQHLAKLPAYMQDAANKAAPTPRPGAAS